jgi:hypothetical protein
MNFADISVKESLSTVTAVVRLATCAERRTGGCPEIEPSRDETTRHDTLVRSKYQVPFQGQ